MVWGAAPQQILIFFIPESWCFYDSPFFLPSSLSSYYTYFIFIFLSHYLFPLFYWLLIFLSDEDKGLYDIALLKMVRLLIECGYFDDSEEYSMLIKMESETSNDESDTNSCLGWMRKRSSVKKGNICDFVLFSISHITVYIYLKKKLGSTIKIFSQYFCFNYYLTTFNKLIYRHFSYALQRVG